MVFNGGYIREESNTENGLSILLRMSVNNVYHSMHQYIFLLFIFISINMIIQGLLLVSSVRIVSVIVFFLENYMSKLKNIIAIIYILYFIYQDYIY